MAVSYKILGQSAPADTNNADLYTVPANTETVISTLLVTNTTASPAKCRIFVRSNGATAATSNALVYDAEVNGNDFKAITIGITVNSTDVISVRSSIADALTFQAFGSETA